MKIEKIEISAEEAEALLERAQGGTITQDDYKIIKGLIETHMLLTQAVAEKSSSIKRLLQMVFGYKTEKNKGSSAKNTHRPKKKKAKGHGKNGVDEYPGAETVEVPHETLQHCDPCPACVDGKVYLQQTSGVFVHIKGAAPLPAIVYQQEKLRCNICGKVFTADLPKEAGNKRFDETASAMLALLRYGSGLPLNRIAKLQAGFGIPFPTSTQWDVLEKMADQIYRVFPALIKYAAQGDVIHNDDTTMKIQEMMVTGQENNQKSRTGVFTTGILSITAERKVALFFTGKKHAGENMAQLLEKRHNCLDPPVQMCDALSRNTSGAFQTILANCLSHGRRNFFNIVGDFPDECQYVLDTLGKVYHNDALAAEKNMEPHQRLLFHQAESRPLMSKLSNWLQEQFDNKKVEPNSSLGKAISYMMNHWKELTLFLRVEKAPLDNNICERALKMAILHRKNSLYYKTENGAYIGDMFMSLIHTCSLSKVNPFDYLVALQKNSSAVFRNPGQWLPWNYQTSLASSTV